MSEVANTTSGPRTGPLACKKSLPPCLVFQGERIGTVTFVYGTDIFGIITETYICNAVIYRLLKLKNHGKLF